MKRRCKDGFFGPATPIPTTTNRPRPVGAAPFIQVVETAPEDVIARISPETPTKMAENRLSSYPQCVLVLSLEIVLPFIQLHTVRTLQSRGVENVATIIASRKLPFAGRLAHFITNWGKITQDKWVLQTMLGLRIEFLQKPK